MADFEEKKDKFSTAINHYAEEQRQKIEKEIEEYKQKELEEAEIDVLTECYQLIQKETARMRSGISREMAQRDMDARRKLLEQRSRITSEVFEKASQKLKEFTGQKEYLDFLQNTASQFAKIFGHDGIVIRLRADDEKYEDNIRKALGLKCEFQIDNTIVLGGLRAVHTELGLLADKTLDSLLEDQRGWFESHSGMTVV